MVKATINKSKGLGQEGVKTNEVQKKRVNRKKEGKIEGLGIDGAEDF